MADIHTLTAALLGSVVLASVVVSGAVVTRDSVAGFSFSPQSQERTSLTTTSAGASNSSNPSAPSDDEVGFREVESLDKAQEITTFTVKRPTTLPEGYSLHQIMVGVDGKSYILYYDSNDGENIGISVVSPEEREQAEGTYRKDSEVTINGNEGYYFDANGINGVEFVGENGAWYLVQGSLTKNQSIAIAESLETVN